MRFVRSMIAAWLVCGSAAAAQVSTLGTTAMGLPTTPGAMVSSPLGGPSPFSAATQPGAPDTTLAPVPMALDPTIPGTSINCIQTSAPIATMPAITPPTPATPVAIGSITAPAGMNTAAAATPVAPSAMAAIGVVTAPPIAGAPAPAPPSLAPPAIPPAANASIAVAAAPPPATSATDFDSSSGSSTGTIAPITPVGAATTPNPCMSSTTTSPATPATLPLMTPAISASQMPGTLQPAIAGFGGTSIDPSTAAIPTPNSAACSEEVTMNLSNPGMMEPANASGAAATPGVSPPSGC
jgi:hypothetical protein